MKNEKNNPMFYMDCVDLIKLCIEKKLLKTRDSHVLICRIIDNKETWVLQDINSLAQELRSDTEGQKFLINELKKHGITFIKKWEKFFSELNI